LPPRSDELDDPTATPPDEFPARGESKSTTERRKEQMEIRTRLCMSLDGYLTTSDGRPVQLRDPSFVPGESHGFPDFQRSCDAVSGDLAEAVERLNGEHATNDIAAHGSVQLAQSLIERNLVDELHLMVFPVVLGAGKRLFGETSGKQALTLTDSKPVGDGVQILVYERAS
jgi:RibD C-terminal domain